MPENKNILWSSQWLNDEDMETDWAKNMLEEGIETNKDSYYEHISGLLDDLRSNLNIEVDGIIVAFAELHLWDGHHSASRMYGSNISDILSSSYDAEWYSDGKDIRMTQWHHDGTNHILFRKAKDIQSAYLIFSLVRDQGIKEKEFESYTTSLLPDVAKVFGF